MSEVSEFRTTEEKVQNIEHYLVRKIDAIQRLVVVTMAVSVVAMMLGIWGIAGQQRVISIAEAMGDSPSSGPAAIEITDGPLASGISVPDPDAIATKKTVELPPKGDDKATASSKSPIKPAVKKAPSKMPNADASTPPDAAPKLPVKSEGSQSKVDQKSEPRKAMNADWPKAAPSPSTPTAGRLSVDGSAIASEIVGLSPKGRATSFPRSQAQIYCWSRIVSKNFEGVPQSERVVTHKWHHEGTPVYERRITIGSSSYRVYSMIAEPGSRPGNWHVDIIDAKGRVIGTERFVIE